MTPFFRCAECGDHVKATEYGECAYCGGDVEIIDGEAKMIDIESMDRDALIAEIKRLRKRCPKCGNDGAVHMGSIGKRPVFWIECAPCGIASDAGLTEADAWVSWSGEI